MTGRDFHEVLLDGKNMMQPMCNMNRFLKQTSTEMLMYIHNYSWETYMAHFEQLIGYYAKNQLEYTKLNNIINRVLHENIDFPKEHIPR